MAESYARIQPFGPIILMALLFVGPMLGFDLISLLINPALSGLQKIILGVS